MKKYDEEFKANAIAMAIENKEKQGIPHHETAKSLGCGYSTLARWIQKHNREQKDQIPAAVFEEFGVEATEQFETDKNLDLAIWDLLINHLPESVSLVSVKTIKSVIAGIIEKEWERSKA